MSCHLNTHIASLDVQDRIHRAAAARQVKAAGVAAAKRDHGLPRRRHALALRTIVSR